MPACLPASGEILPHNSPCYVTGWGRLWSECEEPGRVDGHVLLGLNESSSFLQLGDPLLTSCSRPVSLLSTTKPAADTTGGAAWSPAAWSVPEETASWPAAT